MIDMERLAAVVGDDWLINTVDYNSNGVNHTCDINLFKRSAQPKADPDSFFEFSGNKEDYREAQEAPKPTIPHLAERKLWLAQREAGTNEIWRYTPKHRLCCWIDMPVDKEPSWDVECVYEVKPKTVTYYFALMVHSNAKTIASFTFDNRNDLVKFCDRCNYTIIGNIETREVLID